MTCERCQWQDRCKYYKDLPVCLKAKLEYRDRKIKTLLQTISKLTRTPIKKAGKPKK